MELTRLIKFFLVVGVVILLSGYGMYLNEIGGVSGAVIMFSGGSLVVASLFATFTKLRNWLF